MENNLLGQLTAFAYSLCWGGCVGILYELCGVLRVLGRSVLTAFADLFFWVCAALSTFLFLLVHSGGAVKGYLLTAIVGGAVLVHLFLAKITARAEKHVRERILQGRRKRKARAARKKQQKN